MKPYTINKNASFNYTIIEKYEAGIVLLGFEVKAVKTGRATIQGSHITVEHNEVFLIGTTIAPYQPANTPPDYDPQRKRKLLLTKREIKTLLGKKAQAGLTIVPIKMYNKNNTIKVEIALARGKKKHDKRERIKKRDTDRDIRRVHAQ